MADVSTVLPNGRGVAEEGPGLTSSTFWDRYLLENTPVVVRAACRGSWPAFHRMATGDTLHYGYLASLLGDSPVSVVRAPQPDARGLTYGGGDRVEVAFKQFLLGLQGSETGDYAKDFHFILVCPRADDYAVPALVADDWLNWWFDASGDRDDYRFLYLGPPGTATPLHHDVLCSASWSVNVTGQKLWVLVPPEESAALYDAAGNLVTSSVLTEGEAAALGRTLLGRPLGGGGGGGGGGAGGGLQPPPLRTRHVVLQHPGDLVFVPSGWHHEVYNVGDAPVLSINHNWFCGASLRHVWGFLQREVAAVRGAIGHVRGSMGEHGWQAHVQLLLRANCGFDLHTFGALVANKAALLLHQGQLAGDAAVAHADDHALSGCAGVPVLQAPHLPLRAGPRQHSLREAGTVLRALLLDDVYSGPGGPAPAWRALGCCPPAYVVARGDGGGGAAAPVVDVPALLAAIEEGARA